MKKITALGSIFLATVLILIGGLGINNRASAQNVQNQEVTSAQNTGQGNVVGQEVGDQASAMVQMPSISVDFVNIVKQDYVSDDEVTGVFSVTNRSNVLLENTSYRVLIGENYEEIDADFKMTNSFLDATDLASLGNIKPGETKKVSFKYKIPSFLKSEKAAIQINVYTNNAIILGSNSSNYVKIESKAQEVLFSDIKLVLSDGKEYNLTEGPTIYKDKDPKTAALSVKIKNTSKADISIEPNLATYNQQDRLNKTNTTAPITRLKAGETKTVSIELPTMDYVSAVYFSEVSFINAENRKPLASRAGVRYIVGGDMATVHSVQVDKDKVKVGDTIKLDYVVTGKPGDIANRVVSTSTFKGNIADAYLEKTIVVKKEGKVSIKIINESNEVVAEVSRPLDLFGDNTESVEVLALEDAKAMKALVFIHNEEGFVFAKKEVYLSGDFEKISKEEKLKKDAMAVGSIVLILIISLLSYVMYRKNKLSIKALILVFILGAASIPAIASAWNSTGLAYICSMPADYDPQSLSVSTPYDLQVFVEGSSFVWSGYVYHRICSNSGSNLTLSFYNNASGESGSRLFNSVSASGGHYVWYENTYFRTKSTNVGNRPGYYTLNFWISDGCFVQYGNVPFYVVCSAGRVRGPGGSCTYPPPPVTTTPPVVTTTTGGGGGGSSTTTTTGGGSGASTPAVCGTQANSSVVKGTTVNTSNLCGTGNNLSGNLSFNYLNSEWRWVCSGSSNSTATCKTSCATGTNFCAASNKCSSNSECTDWCSNIDGNQTNRNAYVIDKDGICLDPKFINNFKLSPSISNSQGVCKVFWSTANPLDEGTLTCKMNGTAVSCTNDTVGLDVMPGVTKFEATLEVASSTYSEIKELRCTQNPNLIEI